MQGAWIHCFDEAVPTAVDNETLKKKNKDITFDQVQEWIEEHDGIAGRFSFYESFGRTSVFYQKVARPLLSMRAVGSIDVERRIKPMKHTILTKDRNRLNDVKGATLMRARENLNHLLRAKMALGLRMSDNLN